MAKTGSLQYAWRLLEVRGFRATFDALIRTLRYNRGRWVVTEKILPGPPIELAPDDAIVVRRATDDDLQCLDSLRPHRNPDTLRARVRHDGCILCVARDGDRIVAFRLATPQLTPYLRFLGLDRFLRLGEDDLFVQEIFTHPDYRKRGIALRLSLVSEQLFAELGYRRYVTLTRPNNVASLRLAFRRGSRPILYVRHAQFLFYRRFEVSEELPPKVAELFAVPQGEEGGEPDRAAPP